MKDKKADPYREARRKFTRAQEAYKRACAKMRKADDELARSRGLPR